MKTIMSVVAVALLGGGLTLGSAMAGGDPVLKCSSSKMKASGKAESGELKCLSKLASNGTPADACITAAQGKFTDAFTAADSLVQPTCEGTASTVENAINNCIDNVTMAITGSGKCQASKLKAAGKKAASKLKCYQKAPTAPSTDPTLVACLKAATDKFSASFDKAEAAGACAGAKNVVETDIDNLCVTNVKNQLPPVAVGCGNGVVDPGETCDDGNTVNGDDCPSSCVIQACTATATTLSVSVKFTPPGGSPAVGGLGLFVDYPDGKLTLPATTFSSGVSGTPHDRNYGITEDLIDSNGTGLPTSPNALLHLVFKTCQGAPAATAGDFTCTVTDAVDESAGNLNPSTMTCTVTIP